MGAVGGGRAGRGICWVFTVRRLARGMDPAAIAAGAAGAACGAAAGGGLEGEFAVEGVEAAGGELRGDENEDHAGDGGEVDFAEAEGEPMEGAEERAGGLVGVLPEGPASEIDVAMDEVGEEEADGEPFPGEVGAEADDGGLLPGVLGGGGGREEAAVDEEEADDPPKEAADEEGEEELEEEGPAGGEAEEAADQPVLGVEVWEAPVEHDEEEEPTVEDEEEEGEAGEREEEHAPEVIAPEGEGDSAQIQGGHPLERAAEKPVEEGSEEEQGGEDGEIDPALRGFGFGVLEGGGDREAGDAQGLAGDGSPIDPEEEPEEVEEPVDEIEGRREASGFHAVRKRASRRPLRARERTQARQGLPGRRPVTSC